MGTLWPTKKNHDVTFHGHFIDFLYFMENPCPSHGYFSHVVNCLPIPYSFEWSALTVNLL